ncbi:unnamed protein product [Rangifer tarandus platyrhynchus]|uniref:Uncharacterized protein n=2 Tax=Rangifer tarandus platyrhynchus TaxID=3082113 RepID=A0AC59YB97_RANTA|nr:unnamed protein product [Rangifer tarandus platyrhynchus]
MWSLSFTAGLAATSVLITTDEILCASCAKSLQLCPTLRPVDLARQAPLSVGFSRQEHWRGMPCPPPGDRPDPGIKPKSPTSPALASGLFTTSTTWEVRSTYFGWGLNLHLPRGRQEFYH